MANLAYKYAIVGNSAGGIGAIEAIREADSLGAIAIFSDETLPAYSRPGIAELVSGAKTVETITYRGLDFYEKRGVSTHFGEVVARIDPKAQTLTLENGDTVSYEKLLLATGGTPIRPPMEGYELEGIYNFTTAADALALKERIETVGNRVVVIGAGLIGAACSDALVKAGAKPTVIELRDRPLNLLLDEPGSEMARRAMTEFGVNLICGATVKTVVGRADNPKSVGMAILADGRQIECDAVVVAVGVRPRLNLAQESGITTNRGIVVDRSMKTSDSNVYACGDVAEAYDCIIGGNRVVPIWPGAFRGGRVAGANMAGGSATSDDATVMNSLKYFGMALVSAGEISVAGAEGYETLRRLDLGYDHGKDLYKKIVIKDNRLVGFVFAGDIEHSGIFNWLLRERIDVSAFSASLLKDNFDLIDLPAELRQSHYQTATAVARQLSWGRPLTTAAAPRTNGGLNGGH